MIEKTNMLPVVFILGIMPRSGTHFLANLLCQHPDCDKSVIPEDCLTISALSLDNYANRIYRQWQIEGDLPDVPLKEMLLESLGNGLKSFLLKVREETLKNNNSGEFENEKFNQKSKYLITKTPQVVNLDKFFEIFPNEKLLIIVRDGRALVESINKSFSYNREEAIRDWVIAAKRIISFEKNQKNIPKPYMIVKYEELHSGTEHEICKVLRFLELDAESYDFKSALNMPVVGSSVFKRGNGAVHWIPVKKTEEFKPLERAEKWTRAQHERFNWLAKNELIYFGYEPKEFEGSKFFWKLRNHLMDFRTAIKILVGKVKKKLHKLKVKIKL